MKLFVALCLVAAVSCAPQGDNGLDGAYDYYAHKQYLGNYVPDTRGRYVPETKTARKFGQSSFGSAGAGRTQAIGVESASQAATGASRSGFGSDAVVVESAVSGSGNAFDAAATSGRFGAASSGFGGSASSGFGGSASSGFGGSAASGFGGSASSGFGASSGASRFQSGRNTGANGGILRLDNDLNADGYHYAYETSNQIAAEEEGRFRTVARSGDQTIDAHGFYQYVGPDGRLYRVDYTADENGFQATGDHLPTPLRSPPISSALWTSLPARATKYL